MISRLSAARLGLGLIACTLAPACASLEFEREGATSGTFTSTAVSFTFFSYDIPGPALSIAQGNAADTGQPNLLITEETVWPYFGRLDWILDIISVRRARVTGTWGR